MKPALRLRLDQLTERFEELTALLSDSDVINDNMRYRNLSQEHHDLALLTHTWQQYCQAELDIKTAEDMRLDPELREMADEERQAAMDRIVSLEAELNILMLPKDPSDHHSAFLEIRAGWYS